MQAYVEAHTTPPDAVLAELAGVNAGLGDLVDMQISPDQGRFLTLVAQLTGAQNAVEVGTFTGYSSICIARGLADRGRLLCCDVSDEWTSIAQRFWKKAGVSNRIELRLGAALETLHSLPGSPQFDLAFIDADKTAYRSYWDELVPRMLPGGVLLADNVFQDGRVVDADDNDADVVAIREFNDYVIADDRVDVVMLPIADGLTFARKR